MIRKIFLTKQKVDPANAVLERSAENRPDPASHPPQDTWLSSATGSDSRIRARQARLLASELFVKTRLAPHLTQTTSLNEDSLTDLLVEFKRSRPGPGVDFELSQVMGTLLNRFQYHILDATGDALQEVPEALELDILLYASLADLDLHQVDEAVRIRMHTG
jgi:hypothetical protein